MQERAIVGGTGPRNVPLPAIATRIPGPGWVYAYVGVEIACQLALLVSALAPARILFRSAAFGISLAFLFLVPGGPLTRHPARTLALIVIGILTLSALNPMGSTPLAVIAHFSFHLAILAPLFWVARLRATHQTLVTLLSIIWAFSTLSSIFGMLQAYFPGQFQPNVSTLIRPDLIMAIKLSSGTWVARPMGLTDIPGGAASSGFYAALLGLGLTLAKPYRWARPAGILSMIAGTTCIYLCQVRAIVVMLVVCAIVLLGIFALSGRLSRLAVAMVLVGGIGLVGFYVAFSLAGDTITSRLATLVEDDPGSVYLRNRGRLVQTDLSEALPKYPFGAGLGRWGMMNQYFGLPEDMIWAEVQWSGWIIDGGIFLLIAYPVAVIAVIATAIRAGLNPLGGDQGIWAAIVGAYGVGTLALSFSYPVFMSTGGIQFWLINAVALQAAGYVALAKPESSERPS
jgi:hypothetical protein